MSSTNKTPRWQCSCSSRPSQLFLTRSVDKFQLEVLPPTFPHIILLVTPKNISTDFRLWPATAAVTEKRKSLECVYDDLRTGL